MKPHLNHFSDSSEISRDGVSRPICFICGRPLVWQTGIFMRRWEVVSCVSWINDWKFNSLWTDTQAPFKPYVVEPSSWSFNSPDLHGRVIYLHRPRVINLFRWAWRMVIFGCGSLRWRLASNLVALVLIGRAVAMYKWSHFSVRS